MDTVLFIGFYWERIQLFYDDFLVKGLFVFQSSFKARAVALSVVSSSSFSEAKLAFIIWTHTGLPVT